MSETKIETVVVETGDRDHEAPLIILGVFQQVISADMAVFQFKQNDNLTDEGPRILNMLMYGGRDPRSADGSLNLPQLLGEICGFSDIRTKAALAKAVSAGLLKGGPSPS